MVVPAFAKKGGGGKSRNMVSVTAMALASSTTQGGEGPAGSSILSQSEYVHGWSNFGLGLFFQYDMQGTSEKDTAYGPKIEFYLGHFFLEVGYAIVKRAFTDRTIAEQTGDGTIVGLGVRFSLGKGGKGGKGAFFQASYKMRTVNIKQQDGTDLSQPIVQNDSYPLLGIGYSF